MKLSRQVMAAVVAVGVIAAMAVLMLELSLEGRGAKLQLPAPETPVSPAEVRVKAVERKAEPVEQGKAALASGAVAIVFGMDEATADRYEARNDALRSIARRRDLPKDDVEALLAYLRRSDDALRVERVAALKNDVMNLLRNQESPVEGLAETLMGMIEGKGGDCGGAAGVRALPGDTVHPPVVIDYCIQHLGAMVNELDDAGRKAVRGVLVKAASDKTKPYAGTALYSLAEDSCATMAQKAATKRGPPVMRTSAMSAQESELKWLTLALCKPVVNNVARIAAIQLAGQRGYVEALPILRETLSGAGRDAVLDTVCIGSVGLLGNADDIPILSRFATDSRRAAAVEAAIQRIKERANVNRNSEG